MSISRVPSILSALASVARPLISPVRRASDAAATQPPKFRHLSPEERRRTLETLRTLPARTLDGHQVSEQTLNKLYENVWSTHCMAASAVPGVSINGTSVILPFVTEEPSVVAAIANAAKKGLFTGTGPEKAICGAQVLLVQQQHLGISSQAAIDRLKVSEPDLKVLLETAAPDKVQRLFQRGGGFEGPFAYSALSDQMVVSTLHFDVLEAMGANVVNMAVEFLGPKMAELLPGWASRMHILTNNSAKRVSLAMQQIPFDALKTDSLSGEAVAHRMAEASEFALLSEDRAVTHNKGIMNGAAALALATGQDTRALESAAHFFARNLGKNPVTGTLQYGPLATWAIEGGSLVGRIALPTPTTTVGRLVAEHRGVRLAFELLGRPNNRDLGLYMAVAGLASNQAALQALCTVGINQGHLRLHNSYNCEP